MTENDMNVLIRSWLSARDPGEAPESLRDAVARVPNAEPRSWRLGLNRFVPAALGAAAVVVVALIGLQLLVGGGVAGPGPVPVSSPTIAPTSAPTAHPRQEYRYLSCYPTECGPLTPGSHVIDETTPLLLTISLPEGCNRFDSSRPLWMAYCDDIGTIGFATVDALDPCLTEGDFLWNAIIDGFAGGRLEFGPQSSGCHPNRVLDWLHDPGGRGPSGDLTVWALDVDGVWLVMYAMAGPDGAADQEELRHLVESVQIERP